jgi:tRNA dimethylallyltransferase
MPANLFVILGPTAVGKTKLAASLCAHFNGEVISADSRQVYKGMDIGTGKDISDYTIDGKLIPYHIVDILEPDQEYNLFLFKQDFYKAFNNILSRHKRPFLTGGTGLYLSAVVQNYQLNKADFTNGINELQNKSLAELTDILFELNPKLHNTTDLLDKERIIRAIQIAQAEAETNESPVEELKPFILGVRADREIVKKRITERLELRLENGMIEEVENLLAHGITYDKLIFFGLEYKFIALFLKGELTYNDMFQKLNSAIHKFAKRQMTWYRKMEKEGVVINWIKGADVNEAVSLINKELGNNIEL